MDRLPAAPPSSSAYPASRAIPTSAWTGCSDDVRALAAREGYAVAAEHVDDGYSGAIRNRPGFLAWLSDGREGRADALLAWHVDRMTREGVNVAALILDVVEGKITETGRVVEPIARGAARPLAESLSALDDLDPALIGRDDVAIRRAVDAAAPPSFGTACDREINEYRASTRARLRARPASPSRTLAA